MRSDPSPSPDALRISGSPPEGLDVLRRLCLDHDGVDPFQHVPPFGEEPAPAVFVHVTGPDGIAAFGAVWGDRNPMAIVCVAPRYRRRGLGAAVGDALTHAGAPRQAGEITSWVAGAHAGIDMFCDRWQGILDRRLMKLEISLPRPPADGAERLPPGYALGSFRDEDADAVVTLNAAAFAGHPEQAALTVSDIEDRRREDWFDPEGFLLVWDGDELAAFCWTRMHPETDPPEGEIYVICTSPRHRGTGLGRSATLAGLQHLARRTAKGILYVDETNVPARRMYREMGFRLERVDGHYRFPSGS